MKKFLILASAAVMLFGAVTAFADTTAQEINSEKEILLTVEIAEDGEAQSGIGVKIYKVADVDVQVGVAVYAPLIGDADYDGMTARENEEAAAALAESDLSGLVSFSGTTDENGRAEFTDLSAGAYLVVQASGGEGYEFSPFIAFAPQCNADESWIYAVTASPKTGSAVTQTEKVKTGDAGIPFSYLAAVIFAGGAIAAAGTANFRGIKKRKAG